MVTVNKEANQSVVYTNGKDRFLKFVNLYKYFFITRKPFFHLTLFLWNSFLNLKHFVTILSWNLHCTLGISGKSRGIIRRKVSGSAGV